MSSRIQTFNLDNGNWVVSARDCWFPGSYDSEEAAKLAAENLPDEIVIELQKSVAPGVVTLKKVQDAMKVVRKIVNCVRCANQGFDFCPECMRPGEEIRRLREIERAAKCVIGAYDRGLLQPIGPADSIEILKSTLEKTP